MGELARVSGRSIGGRTATLIVLGAFLAIGSVASGHLYSIDGLQYFRVGERLLLDRSWIYDPPLVWGEPILSPITPIGLSLAYWPALLLSLPLLPFQPQFGSLPYDQGLLYNDPVYLASSWVNPLIAALSVLATIALSVRVGIGRPTAMLIGFSALFAGPLFFYARGDVPQPFSAALLVTSLYLAIRVRQRDAPRAGILLAVIATAILTRSVDGLLTTAASAVVLAIPSPIWAPIRQGRRAFVEVAAGALAGSAITLFINFARRGSFLDFGFGPTGFVSSLPLGLTAELLSPGRGLVWYLPLTALAVIGAVILWKARHRAELVSLAFPILAYLLVYAKWGSLGGWAWGPRYLVPVTPLIVLLAGIVLPPVGPRAGRIAFGVLAGLGALENLAHVGVDQLQGFWGTYGDDWFGTAGFWRQFEIGAFAPISSWGNFSGTPDVMWFRLINSTGGLSLAVGFALLLGAGACILTAIRAVRGSPEPAD